MSRVTARLIVGAYDAYVKANGVEWTEKHFLAKGTARYENNKRLLEQAQAKLHKGKARKSK